MPKGEGYTYILEIWNLFDYQELCLLGCVLATMSNLEVSAVNWVILTSMVIQRMYNCHPHISVENKWQHYGSIFSSCTESGALLARLSLFIFNSHSFLKCRLNIGLFNPVFKRDSAVQSTASIHPPCPRGASFGGTWISKPYDKVVITNKPCLVYFVIILRVVVSLSLNETARYPLRNLKNLDINEWCCCCRRLKLARAT